MAARELLVIEHEQTNLSLFENYFNEAGFRVRSAVSEEEALDILSASSFDAVLCELSAPRIDGLTVLRELQRSLLHRRCIIVFLTSKSDVWSRTACLRLGADDVIVKPIHAREIVARVGMLWRRRGRCRASSDSSPVFGRLEDHSVTDLIESIGIERRSGLLQLVNENGFTGCMAYRDGCLIAAETGSLYAEEAVFKMMSWRTGIYKISFGRINTEDEMSLSNMGILFQGVKRMDLRNELLKQLPSLDSVVIITTNFRQIVAQKDTNPELREFLTLFDGERTLGRIIDECRENEIVTLKRIVKLYKLGFLHVLKDFGGESEPESEPAEEEELSPFSFLPEEAEEEEIFPRAKGIPFSRPSVTMHEDESAKDFPASSETTEPTMIRAEQLGTILVIGSNEEKARQVVEAMTQKTLQTERVGKLDFRYSTLNSANGSYLTVFCLSTDKELTPLVDYAAKDLAGIILALDKDSTRWDYYRYLINALHRITKAPIHVLFYASAGKSVEFDQVRKLLNAPAWVEVHVQSTFEPTALQRLLFVLLKKRRPDAAAFVNQ
ncbi:MAG: response regulator [candidate division KSB1 bacterium]|nr:response regulator [candidate division KSB1 bacterium]